MHQFSEYWEYLPDFFHQFLLRHILLRKQNDRCVLLIHRIQENISQWFQYLFRDIDNGMMYKHSAFLCVILL